MISFVDENSGKIRNISHFVVSASSRYNLYYGKDGILFTSGLLHSEVQLLIFSDGFFIPRQTLLFSATLPKLLVEFTKAGIYVMCM